MEHGSVLALASDGDGDKEYLMKLSIIELISNLRTAFRMIDYDRVEEVLVEKENKLKAEIKVLTDRLELERLERMSLQDELRKFKEQCEIRKHAKERYEKPLEEVKKNDDLDDGNMIAKLRIRNAELEDEKRRVDESWKKKFEELKERLLIVEKGANLFMNGDTDMENGGDPRLSNKVIGEKDMNDVDICDNEHENVTAGAPPPQRKDLNFANIHSPAVEVTRQSPDFPNKAVLGTSGVSVEEVVDGHDNNEVDIDDHECRNIAVDGRGNAHLAVDDDARQSLDNPNIAELVASEVTTENAVDIHDHECGNTAADTSPSKTDDCGNTHLTDDDDDSRQSPDTPNTAVPANASMGSQKAVIETKDSDDDDDDDKCFTSGGLVLSKNLPHVTRVLSTLNFLEGVSAEEVVDGHDNNEVDIDDHECGNITADDCANVHPAVDDDARQSVDTPNTAELGASEATTKNAVDICDHDCGNTAADASPSKTDDGGNTHLSVDDDSRQSQDTSSMAVLGASGVSVEDVDRQDNNEVDIDDHECGNIAADDCGNAHLTVDDDARQSPDTPKTAMPANASMGSRKAVIEIKDSDDDDDECFTSGALNGKEATHNIAATVDDIGHSSLSRPQQAVIEIKDSDNDDDWCITSGALNEKEATQDIAITLNDIGHSSLSSPLQQESNASPVRVNEMIGSLKRKWFPEPGNSFDRLNKNLVDGTDSDDDSSSSTSSSEIDKVKLPSNFLCSTGSKRRKT